MPTELTFWLIVWIFGFLVFMGLSFIYKEYKNKNRLLEQKLTEIEREVAAIKKDIIDLKATIENT